MDLKNQTVNFRICDIFYPDCHQVLFGLHGNDVLHGRVVDFSEGGPGPAGAAFAEIAVDELEELLIVPLDRILSIGE